MRFETIDRWDRRFFGAVTVSFVPFLVAVALGHKLLFLASFVVSAVCVGIYTVWAVVACVLIWKASE